MGKKLGWISLNILAFFILAIVAGSALAADARKTITGIVTESYQIVTDNDEVYDIGESEAGDNIIENAGRKVKATGKVEYDEETDTRTITIDSFTVLEEKPESEPEMEYEGDPEA